MTYSPPTAHQIADAQNTDSNLRLLLAQRKLYSIAKVWSGIRGFGVGVVAIAAPILTAIWQEAALPMAAIAASWFVLNRLLFKHIEQRYVERAASAQEQFDTAIFGMPVIAVREPRLVPEEVRRLTGGRTQRRKLYSDESLKDWYPVRKDVDGGTAIAISQRANLVYAQTLLTKNATLWAALLIAWILVAFAIGIASKFDLLTFLLVVALPTLPPFLDAVDEWLRVRTAGKQRRAIANEIQDAISTDTPVPPDHLLTWQSQLFALRRDSPLVPDWLYWLLRSRTEDEMTEGAKVIAEQTRSRKDED
ncbi:S-4TM family putative pore-forming effector [Brachybacterium sp. sponge]|uniref:S-4TM family putative pore-forming effector n=1 Tax=Brachybacterium sp. sponge TaxID=1775432 RepID=UPI000AB03D8B|nr:S-4TM family putative pore-forming effector [Brachybacterium sp. sponge]